MKRKYLTGLLTFAFCAIISLSVQAQVKKKDTVGKVIDKTAKKVGHKTAEVVVKGAAKVTDKTWKGKMAPDSSDVYIDNQNRKYYINKKGHKVFLKASQIKNKP